MRFIRKGVKSRISSMGELNSCDSSLSDVDVLTFDEERGGQSGHGVFGSNIAQWHHSPASPKIGQKTAGEARVKGRPRRSWQPGGDYVMDRDCRSRSRPLVGRFGATRVVGPKWGGQLSGVACQ